MDTFVVPMAVIQTPFFLIICIRLGYCFLFYHNLFYGAVIHADDVDAWLESISFLSLQVVDLTDSINAEGLRLDIIDFSGDFIDEEELLPLVGSLIGSQASWGYMKGAVPFINIIQRL